MNGVQLSLVERRLWEADATGSNPVTPMPVFHLAPLTKYQLNPIILRYSNETMTLTEKFKKDVSTLRAASNGDFLLDVKNPKLYKKLFRYYKNEGAVFSGDAVDDYEIIMEYVAQDLEKIEVM